jgi:chemotaxis protein methyltransferase CheR
MSRDTFHRFREYITDSLGIKMPDEKRTMLQSRLQKRLRLLGIDSYAAYCDYVFSPAGVETELNHMIDAVTTNKTDFFRESKHFDSLVAVVLPKLLEAGAAGSDRFNFWSAGCSTGAEPFSLAMVLSEFAAAHCRFRFSILATDISGRVLEEAKEGIYSEAAVAPVPLPLRKKYLLRNKNPQKGVVRITPELRTRVQFGRLNFMAADFGLPRVMDVIFCRNVLIYFDRNTQEQVVNRMCRYLRAGGYLFVGHSETLNGLKVPLTQVRPTIYRKME